MEEGTVVEATVEVATVGATEVVEVMGNFDSYFII